MLQVSRDKLAHLGTCVGKLTHTGKFRLTIASLDLLAQHAKYKVRDSGRSYAGKVRACNP